VNENDLEYPDLSHNNTYKHSLPLAPPEVQFPSSLATFTPGSNGKEMHVEALTVKVVLLDFLGKAEKNHSAVVDVMGWVQNRRRFQNSITTLEVVDDITPLGMSEKYNESESYEDPTRMEHRLKCVLHPKTSYVDYDIYAQVSSPGSHIRVQGIIVSPTPLKQSKSSGDIHRPLVWVQNVTLLCSSWRPNSVSYLIEQAAQNKFNQAEAAAALKISGREMERIVSLKDHTKRQWESAGVSRRMQQQFTDLSLHVDPRSLAILNNYSWLRDKYPVKFVDAAPTSDDMRSDFVSTEGSRWRRKKEPQLEWMAQQVAMVVRESHPDRTFDTNYPLRILDVGGGKGFLATHLARRLLDAGIQVEILVLDISEGAIRNGERRSRRKSLSGAVQFSVVDASTADLTSYGRFDLVVALHACGGLTDVALGHAVIQETPFVICPCCFLSNPHLKVPVAVTSEANSIQQHLPAEEWLNVDPGQYKKLRWLSEVQGDIKLANSAIHTICALRSAAVERHATSPIDVSVQTFPVAFSTRNFCLVSKVLSSTSS